MDFMRCLISRMFIIYYVFSYTRRTVERFSSDGSLRWVIDLFRDDSYFPYLSLRILP